MMKLQFDEDLVETAVFRRASSPHAPSLQAARFQREREKLYAILDPDDRNAAFFKLHLEWFREWNLESLLTGPVKEFPEITGRLKLLVFRKARGKKDEGAELYVNEAGDRTGVVSLCPERLESGRALAPFLRHELLHLRDMVDPAFGYRPELAPSGRYQHQHGLARERYRLLWDISIDGRLVKAGKPPAATRDQRWAEFNPAFAFWTDARRAEVFEALWSNPAPTHASLEALVCDPRQLESGAGPRPGAACPLCGFPTFDWAEASRAEEHADRIRAEFPHWTPRQGLCKRCLAVYRSLSSQTPLVL